MRKLDKSIILFTAIYSLAMIILNLLEETRLDIYVSITILIYFMFISIEPIIRENTRLRILNAILLLIFAVIVVYRVLVILGYTGV